ncbi:CPBP family intramembrane metalloprotease [bacterium 0.1xD8-71]|nr:CPBP family intramembrane metalloprotease [bacterium 0.1xD8-71]
MKSKKANWLFLTIILVHIAVVYLIFMIRDRIEFNMITNCLVSEGIIIVPAILFLLPMKSRFNEALGFRKIKISTFFMIILFTVLIMPLVTVLNAFSMFFAENAVASMHGDILGISFPVMWLLIGVYGPFCEEFVFRGVLYSSYKKTGRMLGAVLLSSLAFGLMHMNFNQAIYAFGIGIFLSMLVEVTGSLWSSAFCHMIFNSSSVCMMYFSDWLMNTFYGGGLADAQEISNEELMAAMSIYLIIAAVTTPIAVCVLAWMAKNEGRVENVRSFRTQREEQGEYLISIPFIVAAVLCLGYMNLEFIL